MDPTEICPHFDVNYAKENFSYCNDDGCKFSYPPPPPPPDGREGLWELQFCKLSGWIWTKNRNFPNMPTKKEKKKPNKKNRCFAICCCDTDSLKNNSTSKISIHPKCSPKPERVYLARKRSHHGKNWPKNIYLNPSYPNQNNEYDCFPSSPHHFPIYCPCMCIPCCCCHHVCHNPEESIQKPKNLEHRTLDCHNATQTMQDVCCRCTQTAEKPPEKRKKNIPLMYCPRRGCCCCSHWCSCVPCPQCYNLCNVKNNCRSRKPDEISNASCKSEEKKDGPKENKNLLSVYPFLTNFNTNKLFLNDLIDPKEEIQYLKTLETFNRTNNEFKFLLNTIYDTIFLKDDNNNNFMCTNNTSTPSDIRQNYTVLNNITERHFEQKTNDSPSLKSLKEVAVNTEMWPNMKETGTEIPGLQSEFKNLALNTDATVTQELSTSTDALLNENFTINDAFNLKNTISYSKNVGRSASNDNIQTISTVSRAKSAKSKENSNKTIMPSYSRTGLLCQVGSNFYRTKLKSPKSTK